MFLGYADYEANECLKQGTSIFTCSYSCACGSEVRDFVGSGVADEVLFGGLECRKPLNRVPFTQLWVV